MNGIIEMCYNNAEISTIGFCLGGISGRMLDGGIITKCYNSAKLSIESTETWSTVAGIVGYTQGKVEISYCYNLGDIENTTEYHNCRASGICDAYSDATILSCYNRGNIKIISLNSNSSAQVAAGICGQAELTTKMSNCYNTGNTTIITQQEDEYARIAGISGYIYKDTIIKNCYWLNTASKTGIADSQEGADLSGVFEKTAEEIKSLAEVLGADFKEDTDNINDGYPILYWQ